MVIQHDLIEALSARVDDLTQRVKLGRSRPRKCCRRRPTWPTRAMTEEQQRGSDNAALETLAFYIGIPASRIVLKDTRAVSHARSSSNITCSRAAPARHPLAGRTACARRSGNLSVAKGELFPTVTAQRQLPRVAGPGLEPDRRDDDAADLHADLRRRPHPRADPPEPRDGAAERAERGATPAHRRPGHAHRLRELQRERGAGRRAARGGALRREAISRRRWRITGAAW